MDVFECAALGGGIDGDLEGGGEGQGGAGYGHLEDSDGADLWDGGDGAGFDEFWGGADVD